MKKVACFTAMLLTILLAIWASAQDSFRPAEIARKASPAVVLIKTTKGQAHSLGTGFLVSSDGKIVTVLHVLKGASKVAAQLGNGDVYDDVSVLAFDQRKDLAIVKVAGFDLPTVELGNSNQTAPGDQVVLIGNPKGLQSTVTIGVISGIREVEGFKVLQTDAAANPGNSGGPLLNTAGQVVGVLDFKIADGESLNFAVPINYVNGMLANLQVPITLAEMNRRLAAAVPPAELARNETSPGAPTSATKNSQSFVHVYRYKQFIGSSLEPSFYCDETQVARMDNGRYLTLGLTPGLHMFRSNDKQSGIQLDLKEGQAYYIRVEIATGLLKGHGRLVLVQPEQGSLEIKKLKYLDADKITAPHLIQPLH